MTVDNEVPLEANDVLHDDGHTFDREEDVDEHENDDHISDLEDGPDLDDSNDEDPRPYAL